MRPLVRRAAGSAGPFVERYLDWAALLDDFEPVRVDSAFDAPIPDPREPGRDLATPWGEPVHYRGRINALVVDAEGTFWLLVHRVGAWSDGEALRLDEDAVADVWAWEHQHLDITIRGVLFNELTPEGRFRRSVRRLSRFQVEDAGVRLGEEALDMLGPRLAVYPTPAPHCAPCPFVAPCLAMTERGDAEEILAASYRQRPAATPVEVDVNDSRWSSGRGSTRPG